MSSVAPTNSTSTTSGYIFERTPDRFGGKQEFYIAETKKIVTATADTFRTAMGEGKDLLCLFHETLAVLGSERQRVAKEQGMENAGLFGIRRDLQDSFEGIGGITALFSPYEAYNERLLPTIQKHLRGLDRTLREFKQRELIIDTGKMGDRASGLDINILSAEGAAEWGPKYTEAYYHEVCRLCSATPKEGPFDGNTFFSALITNKEAMQKLKQVSMKDYKRLKMGPVINHCYHTFKGRKSDWAIVTVRTEIDHKMVALSQYVTWMNRDFKTDPVEHMIEEALVFESGALKKKILRNSDVTILHQDPFLVDQTLNEIAKLFKQAVECSHNDLPALISTVAQLRYLYSHAMPFKRGSSATGEWLEQAIYRYHGYDLEYKKTNLVDMEALTLPLKDFAKVYPLMIKLTKSESKSA